MALDQSSLSSEDVRKQGNELYRAGKYAEAISYYQRAAGLAPSQAAPWSNLSAAYLELGDYTACDAACRSGLGLLVDVPEDDSVRQKVYIRQAKARIYGRRLGDARSAVDLLTQSQEKSDLERCLETYNANQAHVDNIKAAHTRIIVELPRYKPMIRSVPEYYVIGHDSPESMFDPDLAKSERKKNSLLFGGIGDARNLHCTLLQIFQDEYHPGTKKHKTAEKSSGKLSHFTVVDIKAAAIARDFVIFLMLDELAGYEGDPEGMHKSLLVPCLYYTYLAPIMPRGVYDVLQKRIKLAVDMLEGRKDLPPFLDVPQLYRDGILKILKEWQGEALAEYPTERVRKAAALYRAIEKSQMMHQMGAFAFGPFGGPPESPAGCEDEESFYDSCGVLPLTSNRYKLYRPELRKCIEQSTGRQVRDLKALAQKAVSIADATWATNVTQVDLAWQRNRPDDNVDIDVGENPFNFASKMADIGLVPPNPKGLYDYVSYWFLTVASALSSLKSRIKIEACVGDITAVLEQVRYGVVGHRQQPDQRGPNTLPPPNTVEEAAMTELSLNDVNEYPTTYDRIHLSNIPDYIGGTLSSFLYALPLTYPDKSSFITSTCLRNPPRFDTVAQFDSEYIALSAPADLAKVFQVRMAPKKDPYEPMPMCSYNRWHHQDVSTDPANLMSRGMLETWLYRIFLKIAIPKDKRQIESQVLIYSPLNLTVFFRLCWHLHNVGYPAHWMSGVLTEVLSGKIATRARPPRSEPLSIREVKTAMPVVV
ncbi:hypothetical protein LTR85_000373 [Meristemomyces frigidus]|nr:hypothetical protein LTR85_000373 [Meristemomyces frigidus]